MKRAGWPLLLVLCLGIACGDAPEPTAEAPPAPPSAPPAAAAHPSPGHQRMLAELRRIADRADTENVYVGGAQVRQLRGQRTALPRDAAATERLGLLLRLATAELRLGEQEPALDSLRQAEALLASTPPEALPPRAAGRVRYRLAIAYLRLAESENCVEHGGAAACILPIAPEAVHRKPEGARRAAELLRRNLASMPAGSRPYLEALWLYNLARMVLGEYPQGVEADYRIAPQALGQTRGFPRLRNLAPQLGLDTVSLAGGAAAEDFDGDGRLDLMVSTADPEGQLRLFRNRGLQGFAEITEAAGLTGLFGGLNLIQADYDNDGDTDILVLRGAWSFQRGRHPNSLLRNDGEVWSDVTFEAGLGERHFPTQTAAWGDYDLDGDLDLYIGNESFQGVRYPSELFRNEGDGTFTEVGAAAGVINDDFAKAVAWGDVDGDRWPDLFISNYQGYNRLYRNRGDGTFQDVAAERGLQQPVESFPSWFWDFDNDGHLDLFVSSYRAGIADLAADYLGHSADPGLLPRLLRGDGSGAWRQVPRQGAIERPMAPMGANFGDLDNDGYLDLYLGTGWPELDALMPNLLFHNQADRGFRDITMASGLGHLQKGHAVVFADFDHDGDLDIFQQMGGFYRADAFADAFYENPGFGHRWLALRLVGQRSNRSAIGARIRVDLLADGKRRSIYRHVGTGGSFGANPLRQVLGLGRAEAIEGLEVYWPLTDQRQVFRGVPMQTLLRITEEQEDFEVLPYEAFELPGSAAHPQAHG